MNLATRCPACGTVFRVVPDQLKVSDGWVRCGRCSEVFDAGQRLFELDSAATPEPASAPAAPPLPVAGQDAAAPAAPLEAAASEPAEPEAAAALGAEGAEASTTPTAAEPAVEPEVESAVEPPAEPSAEPSTEPAQPPLAAASLDDGAAADRPESAASAALATPEFVRRADHAARWQHPARRGLLVVAAVLLASTLAAQIALHYRDALAARWPASQALLQAACARIGCRIEAPRRMHSLGVDSSSLTRLPDSALYRLSLVVQNRSTTLVRMPAVELTMTDTQGRIVARRVLSAAELGQPVEQLAGGDELGLHALLDLGGASVAGYSVELFYP